jgi:hypothetical protein
MNRRTLRALFAVHLRRYGCAERRMTIAAGRTQSRGTAASLRALLVCVVALTPNLCAAEQGGPNDPPIVEILKHPYPYRASLTILSDLHATTVEQFEAVHTLVNTPQTLRPGDRAWQLLGLDRWSESTGRMELEGFGLPFADAFFVYERNFAIFKDFDETSSSFVASNDPSLEKKFLEWMSRGWIGPLHTFGPRNVTRGKAHAAVDFLLKGASRAPTVWVNHSATVNPSGVGDVCCSLLTQSLLSVRYHLIRLAGQEGLAPKVPGTLLRFGYLLLATSGVGAMLFAGALYCLLLNRAHLGGWIGVGLGGLISVASVGALQITKIDFYHGDNPGSPYFNLDEVRRLGIRYFWTVNSDYWQGTVGEVSLPEGLASTGRETIFRLHSFNDGSPGLFFLRNTIGSDHRTLQLLGSSNLDSLIRGQGRAVIYLHWLSHPERYFDANGIAAMQRLSRHFKAGTLWLAPADQLLDQAYAYSYSLVAASGTTNHARIDIEAFDDPIRGRIPADPDRVAYLSLRCTNCLSATVSVAGRTLPPEMVSTERVQDDLVVTILPPR